MAACGPQWRHAGLNGGMRASMARFKNVQIIPVFPLRRLRQSPGQIASVRVGGEAVLAGESTFYV